MDNKVIVIDDPNTIEAKAKAKALRHVAKLPLLDLPTALEAHVKYLIEYWHGWQREVVKDEEQARCKINYTHGELASGLKK